VGLHALPASYLTKSNFIDYHACPGHAWLKKHHPELIPVYDDPARQRALFFGNQVDQIARARYPGGILIEQLNLSSAVARTYDLICDDQTAPLFQAAILAEAGFVARADVLIRDGEGWHLIEVKSTNSVKSDHLIDAAFQLATLEAAGISITKVSIMHLDRTYRRHGECDPALLFLEQDCTADVRGKLSTIRAEMTAALTALACADQPAPCACDRKTDSNRCPAFSHFHPNVPAAGSIYELSRISAAKIGQVLDRGITMLVDWPPDVPVSDAQGRQISVGRTREAWINRDSLGDFLGQLEYPLYFLDYETSSVPVPMYDGCWPYQQVPFQYSLHIVSQDGAMTHCEYLATETERCPSQLLAEHLASQIGAEGSVVAWHASFERDRNREIGESIPEYASFFANLNERMVDLEDAVSKGWYLHPQFKGRSSIKVVLPIAAPDLSYTTLTIGDGGTASDRWLACALGEIGGPEREETFAALREYCCLDTLAMVRVWQHLCDLCAPASLVAQPMSEQLVPSGSSH
jgi:hypothetical protein